MPRSRGSNLGYRECLRCRMALCIVLQGHRQRRKYKHYERAAWRTREWSSNLCNWTSPVEFGDFREGARSTVVQADAVRAVVHWIDLVNILHLCTDSRMKLPTLEGIPILDTLA